MMDYFAPPYAILISVLNEGPKFQPYILRSITLARNPEPTNRGAKRVKGAEYDSAPSRLLVIFPRWLFHWVHPYDGKVPRIAISFNATTVREGRVSAQAATGGRQAAA
jgi:Putative 2OG-Fe(II) oxygenase